MQSKENHIASEGSKITPKSDFLASRGECDKTYIVDKAARGVFDFAKSFIIGKEARLPVVPKIAPPRSRTYLADTSGKATKRIAKPYIVGKEARSILIIQMQRKADDTIFASRKCILQIQAEETFTIGKGARSAEVPRITVKA